MLPVDICRIAELLEQVDLGSQVVAVEPIEILEVSKDNLDDFLCLSVPMDGVPRLKEFQLLGAVSVI